MEAYAALLLAFLSRERYVSPFHILTQDGTCALSARKLSSTFSIYASSSSDLDLTIISHLEVCWTPENLNKPLICRSTASWGAVEEFCVQYSYYCCLWSLLFSGSFCSYLFRQS